jgi:hypothetical protein
MHPGQCPIIVHYCCTDAGRTVEHKKVHFVLSAGWPPVEKAGEDFLGSALEIAPMISEA